MSKIIVIGAGISGLSIAQLLKKENDVVVFEKNSSPGGLVRCQNINGNLYHQTGGHVFNTKRRDVWEWFLRFFDIDRDFVNATRRAVVSMSNYGFIPYPIENHFYLMDSRVTGAIISDLLQISSEEGVDPSNFEEFLKHQFGDTLYQLYFKPYNEKIWRKDLSDISLSWLEGKLPMPSIPEIFLNNIQRLDEDKFVHSSFYYPLQNGSQFVADKLADGLDIRYCNGVDEMVRESGKWIVNGISADKVVFCGNVKQLPRLIPSLINDEFRFSIESLDYHGTTTVFCDIDENPYSWVYLPSKDYSAHRIICTGNFSKNNNSKGRMTGTVEFTDEISLEEILYNLQRVPLSPRYIKHHYEQCTYPIQSESTRKLITDLKGGLAKSDFFLLGRFAEWEYYNMDVAIGGALDLSSELSIS